MLKLTSAQRRFLRASAHKLEPIVTVGHDGLTSAVKQEVDRSLSHHELLKIKVASGDRDERERMLNGLCEDLDAAPVQHIGKIWVLYRPAEERKLILPQS
jgi:RNA-binding protein